MTEGNSDTADSSGVAIDPLSANWGYYRVGAATRRLVAVSNRVTSTGGAKPDSGGLAVAIRSALQESGGVWFGWSGEVVEEPTDEPGIAVDGPLTFATLDLSRRDYDEYYIGYANRVLWPLFHYRSELVEFSRRYLAGYLRVNQMFARKLAPMLWA
jgi:trehalose 6-phosphate synthase